MPYNLDGSTHDCKSSEEKSMEAQNHDTVVNSKLEKKTLTIEERLARLEETVFGDAE